MTEQRNDPTAPFPDIRWGSDSSRLRDTMVKFAATGAGSALIRTMAPLDRWVLDKSKGRLTALGPIGAPTLLLVTTGAKSGERRVQPLLYYREDPDIYVIGSNFGGDKHPAWTHNLLAGGPAAVIMGREIPVTATLLAAAERDRIQQGFIDMVAVYQTYLGRTDRELRIFRLSAAA
ncbi:nitroreductase family deazaflavin-dependent oxidoreductase [Jongsikchunia kroppenstedtii]|uniref:nitroreductase family deazaflavin-dependent oxidoreductase n=1 Tax=Jongsikchunia kroppenstedtii TaxID=1121721 RepID=UPI00037EAD7C